MKDFQGSNKDYYNLVSHTKVFCLYFSHTMIKVEDDDYGYDEISYLFDWHLTPDWANYKIFQYLYTILGVALWVDEREII